MGCRYGDYTVPDALHRFNLEELLTIGSFRGAAAPATYHAVAWLGLVTGAKHWFLGAPGTEWRGYYPQCEYARDVQDMSSLQCVQRPGEVIFLPEGAWHATCNADEWVVAVGGQTAVAGLGHSIAGAINASWSGDLAALEALANAGGAAAETLRRSAGVSPLHFAVRRNRLDAARLLVGAGADVNAADYDESVTPFAAERRAPTSRYDQRGLRPLHLAARWGHLRVLEWLLSAGADLGARDMRGRTAAHWAAYRSQLGSLRILRDAGADLNAKDLEDATPLMLVLESNGWLSVAELLIGVGRPQQSARPLRPPCAHPPARTRRHARVPIAHKGRGSGKRVCCGAMQVRRCGAAAGDRGAGAWVPELVIPRRLGRATGAADDAGEARVRS